MELAQLFWKQWRGYENQPAVSRVMEAILSGA
jgi:hypothetical protein